MTERRAMLIGGANDLRNLGLAAVAGISTFDPAFATRTGAILVFLLALPSFRPTRLTLADWLAIATAILTFVSLAWTISPTLTTPVWKDQIAVAFLFVSLRMAITNRRALVMVGLGYLLGCANAIRLLLAENSLTRLALSGDQGPRYTIEGLNANYVAYALAGGVAVAVLLSQVRRRFLPLLILAAFGIFAGIRLTGTRGGEIATYLIAGWWLIPSRLRPTGLKFLYLAVAASAFCIFTGVTDKLIKANVHAEAGREVGNLNGRLLLWPQARDAFERHPWLGSGAGTFPAMNQRSIFAHDALLDIGTGLGALGIILFVVLLARTLIVETRGGNKRVRALLVGTALGAITPPLLSGYWHQSPAFWVLVALFSRMVLVTGSELNSELEKRSRVTRIVEPPPAGPTWSMPVKSSGRPREGVDAAGAQDSFGSVSTCRATALARCRPVRQAGLGPQPGSFNEFRNCAILMP